MILLTETGLYCGHVFRCHELLKQRRLSDSLVANNKNMYPSVGGFVHFRFG